MALTAALRPVDIATFDRDSACKSGSLAIKDKTYQITQLDPAPHAKMTRATVDQLTKASRWLLHGIRREMVLKDIRAGGHTLRHVENTPKTNSESNFPSIPTLPLPDVYQICDMIFTKFADYEAISYQADMLELQTNNRDTEIASAKRIEDLKKAIDEEKEAIRWGVAVKAFSWLGSLISIITGIAMVASGVGAAAGALLIVGGVIHVAVQLMEVTGGWAKIFKLLPGDDPAQKSAVISWIQIGLTVLCLALAGSGVLFGGLAAITESFGWAQALIGGIAMAGTGVALIGKGIKDKKWKDKYADVTKDQIELDILKMRKEDLMDSIQRTSDIMEKINELRSSVVGFRHQLEQIYGDK